MHTEPARRRSPAQGNPPRRVGSNAAVPRSGAALSDRPQTPDDVRERLEASLRWLDGRLALRRAVRLGSLGAWIGGGVALLWLLGWILRLAPLPMPGLLLAPVLLGAAAGGLLGRLRGSVPLSERALLLDSLLELDEAAITVVEMGEGAAVDPRAREAKGRLSAALGDGAGLPAKLPLAPPRHARFLPVVLLVLLGGLYVPQVAPRVPPPAKPGDLADEAERLEERKAELEAELDTELPAELEEAFDALVGDMKAGKVDRAAAAERAEDLRERLAELAKQNAEQSGDGAAAAEALQSVDPEAARDLAEALRQGDLAAASDAVESMRERMQGSSPADRERAARELERAAQQAAEAGNQALGDALREEGRRARGGQQQDGQGQGQQGGQPQGQQQGQQGGEQQGQQGGQQGGQQQGQQGGQQGGQPQGQQGGDGLAEYLDQLQQGGVGDLAEQQRLMEMAQEMNGALGGSQGRLGQKGGGGKGQGQGKSPGESWGAGSAHTDAVGEAFSTDGADHRDMDRQVDGRHSSWVVDELGENPEERLQNVQALTQSVRGKLNDGPIDSWTLRLSGSDEDAAAPLASAPPGYRAAAEEAVDGEAVPRAYRDQVKQYFDLDQVPDGAGQE